MVKWLILFGGLYLAYRGLRRLLGRFFTPISPERGDAAGEPKPPPYSKDDIVDVKYREVRDDDGRDGGDHERD
ncbi:MAG: hypothetical protein MAG453_00089 [Calditrichaeota bacterium]|nr:hypothetical protein [Calditrichota bacterium]